jgi:hypothetical protein
MTMFPDSHQDLLTAEVAVLATHGHDGYPQVTALWLSRSSRSKSIPGADWRKRAAQARACWLEQTRHNT